MSRVLTGDRPTGALHLGHYFGTLANRVRLQREGHETLRRRRRLSSDHRSRRVPSDLRDIVRDLVRDYLAVGLDPDATVIFPHSADPRAEPVAVAVPLARRAWAS